MADEKASKLAAARKKLRDHQEKKNHEKRGTNGENATVSLPSASEPHVPITSNVKSTLPFFDTNENEGNLNGNGKLHNLDNNSNEDILNASTSSVAQLNISTGSASEYFANFDPTEDDDFLVGSESTQQAVPPTEHVVLPISQNSVMSPNSSTTLIAPNNISGEYVEAYLQNELNGRNVLTQNELYLRQQLQSYIRAAEILVSEKSNLQINVQSLQNSLQDVQQRMQYLQNSLSVAEQQKSSLEVTLSQNQKINLDRQMQIDQLKQEIQNYRQRETAWVEKSSELEEKVQMIANTLSTKENENSFLLEQLEQVRSQLDLTQLHLQQLTEGNNTDITGPPPDELQKLQIENNQMKERMAKLEEELHEVELEKQQLNLHYQQYVAELNNQLATSKKINTELTRNNNSLADREEQLLNQMNDLEKQIQTQFIIRDKPNCNDTLANENKQLKKNAEDLASINSELQDKLRTLETQKASLELQLSQSADKLEDLSDALQRLELERPDVGKLSADNESDKVAAQRATTQNAKLKTDLSELQDAFVKMSNDKLELTECLQAEKFLNRELTIKLSESEESLKEVRLKIKAKDDEMIRLQANCSDLEKQLLQHTQALDRLQHYDAEQPTSEMFKKQLYTAQSTIRHLTEKNKLLESRNLLENRKENSDVNSDAGKDTKIVDSEEYEIQNEGSSEEPTDVDFNTIPTEEAMLKLEQRFLKTMKDVAELSEEKQRLEHLVLQLQGETDTVGEYIALYQQQRGLLKQREIQRDQQLKFITSEREKMKTQLQQLKDMISRLHKDGYQPTTTHSHPEGSAEMAKEDQPTQAAEVEQIMDLLTEIKHNHLMDSCATVENFHPCIGCSGKLINV